MYSVLIAAKLSQTSQPVDGSCRPVCFLFMEVKVRLNCTDDSIEIIRQSKPLADNGRGLTTQESSSKQKNDNSTERSTVGTVFKLPLWSDCLLFASWNYTVDTQTKVIRVFYDQTQWGDSYQCSLTLPRKAFPRQNTHSTASTLVLPILLISFIFVMLMIIASSRLLTGLLYWCDAIVKEFGSCNFPSDYEIILMWNVRTIDYFGFLASSSLFAWLGCVLWLAVFLSLLARWCMHIDFPGAYVSNGRASSNAQSVAA
ncbi:Brevican core protein [Trichinella spiralis]|uniref:Brevican core protein n=1 Tax=Trichinella spiralis TaxID=6334 RepID=A0ABR3KGG2_TRISP